MLQLRKLSAQLLGILVIVLLASCTEQERSHMIGITGEVDQAIAESLSFGIIFPMADPSYELITEHAEKWLNRTTSVCLLQPRTRQI